MRAGERMTQNQFTPDVPEMLGIVLRRLGDDAIMMHHLHAAEMIAHPLVAQLTGYGIIGQRADKDGQFIHTAAGEID